MTDTKPLRLVERAEACLNSQRRLAFLAELAWNLSVGGREPYPPPETSAYWSQAGFICHNELLHVITAQLRADLGDRGAGYPDPALVQVLADKSRIWGCVTGLRDSLTRAIAATTTDQPADAPRDVFELALTCLGSEHRIVFLVNLYEELTVAARGLFPAPDTNAYREVAGFICFSELQRLLAGQLQSDLDGRGVRSSESALISTMVKTARGGGCDGGLGWALNRALETMERTSEALVK